MIRLLAALLLAGPAAAQTIPAGATLFAERCGLCHGEGGGQGPNLAGVVGRRAGLAPGFGYSRALRAAGQAGLVWTDEALDGFLAAPGRAVPGTTMPLATPDPAMRRTLIAFLHGLKE